MGVGLRLKEVLRDRKISIKQLSELTNVSLNTLYSITKRDSENVDPIILQKIATALSISPTYLIGYDQKIVNPQSYTDDELLEIKAGAWQAYTDSFSEKEKHPLLTAFSKLNNLGQQKAVERVEELTEIPKYQKEKAPAGEQEP